MPKKENEFACRLCGTIPDEVESGCIIHPMNTTNGDPCTVSFAFSYTLEQWRTLMQPGHTEEAIRLAWSVVEGTQPHTVSVDSLIVNLVHLKGMTG